MLVHPAVLDQLEDEKELVHKALRGLKEHADGELVDDDEVWDEIDSILDAGGMSDADEVDSRRARYACSTMFGTSSRSGPTKSGEWLAEQDNWRRMQRRCLMPVGLCRSSTIPQSENGSSAHTESSIWWKKKESLYSESFMEGV